MYLSSPVVIGDTVFGLSPRAGGQFFALENPRTADWRHPSHLARPAQSGT